jgi:hypothetical protein
VVKFTHVPASHHLPPEVQQQQQQQLQSEKKADKQQPAPPKAAPIGPAEKITPRQPEALPKGPEKGPSAVPVAQPASRFGTAVVATPADAVAAPKGEGPPPKPFELTARYVEAKVERSPVRNVVDALFCHGQVRVVQDPPDAGPNGPAKEKGTEVKGDVLKMTAQPAGGYYPRVLYEMKVRSGDKADDLAELTSGRLYVIGPEINVDQLANKAWVIGEGAMQMESTTNFEGKTLETPVPMTVHWEGSMHFDGLTAEFLDGVQAQQQTGRLASQHLRVTFNRMVSLKEGNRSDEQARVRKLVCDQAVRVEEETFDPKLPAKLIKYQSLQALVMHAEALDPDDEKQKAGTAGNRVVASGPGTVRIWEEGSGNAIEFVDGNQNQPGEQKQKQKQQQQQGKAAPPAKQQEFKMTVVSFAQSMQANSQVHTAKFWGNVRVLNLPWPKHDDPLDVEKTLQRLPPGALYLRCDVLEVLDTPANEQANKPANKEMDGRGNVFVQGDDFYAHALRVTYNQLKQQVILYGSKEAPARMVRRIGQGNKEETIDGLTIIHNRGTGRTTVDNTSGVQGETSGHR